MRSILGPVGEWSLSEYLLAGIFDLLAAANWQRTGKKSNRPKPLRRPGDKPDRDTTRIKGTGMSIEELHRRLEAVATSGD